MKTIEKNKTVRTSRRSGKALAQQQYELDSTTIHIAVDQIDPSPFNHRRIYIKKKLEELAASFKIHNILHALIVRLKEGGRYELVTGERRIRAAKMVNFETVPCMVKVLTDQQVKEIQLLENLQRENPHPLEDCWAILQMQEEGKSIAEIAAVLGKSKAFIFGRIQLTKLIEPFHEPFLENKISLTVAFEIACLSPASQQEIFDDYGAEWENDNWQLDDISYTIDRYKYDLTTAPFNIKDKKLLPEMGSCQSCPFNSATYRSLFPEMDTKAICANKDCFKNKCITSKANLYRRAVADHSPHAILHYGFLNDELRMILDSLEETAGLPRIPVYHVNYFYAPEAPKKENFMVSAEADSSPLLDEAQYKRAIEKYEEELSQFNEKVSQQETQKGILVHNDQFIVSYYTSKEDSQVPALGSVTSKEVHQAIKDGNATPELLQKEINRITEKEKRSAEQDRIKVQESVHAQFLKDQQNEESIQKPTSADIMALRLIVYHALGHRVRDLVEEKMIPEEISYRDHEGLLQALGRLTEEQFCFLIRMAVAGDPQSRTPGNITAHAFYKMAIEAGTDVAKIEAQQAEASQERKDKVSLRIKDMETKIERMKKKTATDQEGRA